MEVYTEKGIILKKETYLSEQSKSRTLDFILTKRKFLILFLSEFKTPLSFPSLWRERIRTSKGERGHTNEFPLKEEQTRPGFRKKSTSDRLCSGRALDLNLKMRGPSAKEDNSAPGHYHTIKDDSSRIVETITECIIL